MLEGKKAVVIGGGTGTFPVIAALKRLRADITTVICVSDSGGSTGRIRDEFGFQPVGDLRQALAALAESEGQEWIRRILLYRFSKGDGLKGHNLGNLILTALQDMTGDTTKALDIAEKVFRIEGSVIPVTQEIVDLKINYENGTSQVGEHVLDENASNPKRVASVELIPSAPLNPAARVAIETADVVIIGPGDYFASLQAVLVANGIKEAFAASQATTVYVMNLMTRLTQTPDMTTTDHVKGIESAIGKAVDAIIINDQSISETTLELYANEGEFPVVDDLQSDGRVVRSPIISDQVMNKTAYDTAHRSLLRHDSHKLEQVLQNLLAKES